MTGYLFVIDPAKIPDEAAFQAFNAVVQEVLQGVDGSESRVREFGRLATFEVPDDQPWRASPTVAWPIKGESLEECEARVLAECRARQ